MQATTANPTGFSSGWIIFRTCLEERLVYRGDFALGTLMRFLPILTQIFMWTAIVKVGATIAGYTREEIIAYYLLTMLGRAFSSMPGLASGIALQIRTGEIKKFLIQPIDLLHYLLLARVAHKLVYYAVAFIPFAFVFWLCGGFFPEWPEPQVWAAFVLSLLMGFALGFFLEATLGMIGFWFLEVSSLLFVYMLANFFLSGHMFPLDMLYDAVPGWLETPLRLQPLQYLAYFPAAVFLGKVTGPELWQGLAIQAGWVVFFFVCARTAMQRGYRRYSGFGG